MIRVCIAALLLLVAWSPPALAQNGVAVGEPGQALPEDFRGKVMYFGNHSGEVVSIRTVRGGPTRSDCPRPDQRCPERIGGALEVELEFDGDIVHGKYRGTGGLRESELIGRRVGATCRLYDLTDGSVWSGRCDDQSFFGSVKSVPNAGVQISLSFEVVGTRLRDYSEWERRRRDAILRKRRYERLKAQLNGSGPIETRFAAAIELDSMSWQIDKMQPGSVRDVSRTKPRRGVYEVYGQFGLVGGGTGWARARVEGESIVCAEFWDVPGDCRPLALPAPPPDPEPEPAPPAETSWRLPADSAPGTQPVDVALSLANRTLTR